MTYKGLAVRPVPKRSLPFILVVYVAGARSGGNRMRHDEV